MLYLSCLFMNYEPCFFIGSATSKRPILAGPYRLNRLATSPGGSPAETGIEIALFKYTPAIPLSLPLAWLLF
jgi:hypothetical protein